MGALLSSIDSGSHDDGADVRREREKKSRKTNKRDSVLGKNTVYNVHETSSHILSGWDHKKLHSGER